MNFSFKKAFLALHLYMLLIPVTIFLAGVSLNQAVLIANNGEFPVMANQFHTQQQLTGPQGPDPMEILFGVKTKKPKLPPGYLDEKHVIMTDKTKLNWLADYIDLGDIEGSPGDMLIDLGNLIWDYAPTAWVTLILFDLLGGRGKTQRPRRRSLGASMDSFRDPTPIQHL